MSATSTAANSTADTDFIYHLRNFTLLNGLASDKPVVVRKCRRAVVAFGDRIRGLVLSILADEEWPPIPEYRKTLEALVPKLTEKSRKPPNEFWKIAIAAFFACLEHGKESLVRQCTKALISFGPAIAGDLISEAVRAKNKPDYCLRLLEIVEQTGRPGSMEDDVGLGMVRMHWDERIQELATKLLFTVQRGVRLSRPMID